MVSGSWVTSCHQSPLAKGYREINIIPTCYGSHRFESSFLISKLSNIIDLRFTAIHMKVPFKSQSTFYVDVGL